MKRSRFLIPALLLISWYIFAVSGCSLGSDFIREGAASKPPAGKPDFTIFFVGDAGKVLENEKEPALAALANDLSRSPADSALVIFLGDNIYDHGLPSEGEKGRAAAESYLVAQLEVLRSTHSAVFIPGNHDWDGLSPKGATLMKNQQTLIKEMSSGKATLLPENGCAGPLALDVGDGLRLILFDSQRWFREQSGVSDSSGCAHAVHTNLFSELRRLATSAGGRRIILVHHHPFITYGEHGGYFDWEKHIFPLTAFNKYLLLPLPFIGSLYPLARMNGITIQDLSSSVYRTFADSIREISREIKPVFSISGHEHSLQVIKDPSGEMLQMVSGKGTRLTDGTVSTGEGTLFASPFPGYIRFEMREGKHFSITVVTSEEDSEPKEVFHLEL